MAKKIKTNVTALAKRAAAAVAGKMPAGLEAFERLARDRRLTVEKLGELIKLQEQIMARNAERAFNVAFQAMTPRIPRIAKRGVIRNKARQIQSRYSKYEDIRTVVDPILSEHGFQFHTRTEWPETGVAEIVGILTHAGGHTRESRFRAKPDDSGNKNPIQGLGSAVSYGKRYTLKDLLAIVEEGEDDDGQRAGPPPGDVVDAEQGPPDIHHSDSREKITQPQRQRFATVLRRSGRNAGDVKAWLHRRYGIDSSADITRDIYEAVCTAIERPASLPERQPGEEG